jgi:myo-inositol-1-phosphate synthase
VLTSLFVDRGVKIDRTYQLNFGGNTDFLNMLERERLESKKISKTNAVTSMVPYDMGKDNVHVGPSDHVPWLTDRKWCYIRMEGTTFGNVPLNLELKLEVWDSPNSAGVMIDAVRCAKIALDRELAGPIIGPSSYFFKTPPKQFKDDVAYQKVEDYISGHSGAMSLRFYWYNPPHDKKPLPYFLWLACNAIGILSTRTSDAGYQRAIHGCV